MLTRVDFYLIPATKAIERLQFACKLLEKAYKQKQQAFVYCHDEQETEALDELLWTFNDISFIPHHIGCEGVMPSPPIQLGFQAIPHHQIDIIVNLKRVALKHPTQFPRIIEIVYQDPAQKELSRENYKYYREKKCALHYHNLIT